MPGTGIWLSDQDLQQSGGAIWAQQQIQQLGAMHQAASDWAQQKIAEVQAQARQQMDALMQPPEPAAPIPTPTPSPVEGPASPPVGATPAPAPEPSATPAGALPPTPSPAPSMLPPTPSTEPLPTPQTPMQAGADWASQQIQNLLNPSPAGATPTPAPAPTSAPAAAPAAPGAPQGPQSAAPGDFQTMARNAATAAGIDPDIFSKQINQESGFNPSAQSPAGAQGIAQFMPATAQGLGIDPNDPQAALTAAAKLDASNLQRYGGDWSKALAAYNAGPGNVDKYGGVPPFEETQTYVKNILGGAQNVVQDLAQKGQTAVNTAVQGVQSAVARVSQFGMGLSSGDAMAFCGPAAAIAFAQTYGRNPTVEEAKQLAQQVGWNPGQGMAGPTSEVNLLKSMGVDAHQTNGVDWATVAQDASGGNPVIIDTPGHYYYVDGYNQDTGKFHVGTSGTDLKGGSEWMSSDQINAMPQSGGAARAAIYADHPLAQQPGSAQVQAQTSGPLTMGTMQPPGGPLDLLGSLTGGASSALGHLGSGIADKAQQTLSAVQNVGSDLLKPITDAGQNVPSFLSNLASNAGPALTDFGMHGPIGAFNDNLRGLGQDLMSPAPDWLQQVATNTPVTAVMGPMSDLYKAIQTPGLDELPSSDVVEKQLRGEPLTDNEQRQANGGMLNMMAMTMPTGPGPAITMADRARAYHIGNSIGGLATVSKVALNSALNPAWSFLTRGTADVLGGVTGLAPGLSRAEAFGRAGGSVQGMTAGLANAGSAFLDGMRDVRTNPTSLANRATNVGDVILGRVTETPAALHAAFQGFGQNLLEQMEIGRLYGQDAASMGLTGTGFTSHVASGLASPSPAIQAQAQALAQRGVLRGDLGTLGSYFANMAGQGTGTAGTARSMVGNFLFPVFRVGMNALTQGLEKSPVGLVGTGVDVARGLAGMGPYAGGAFENPVSHAVTPLSERLTNNLAGTAVTLLFAKLALDGSITGDGPNDPQQRSVLEAQGWQPNSIRTPMGYVSYKGTPMEVALGLAGNYADVVNGHVPMTSVEQQYPLAMIAAERMFGHIGDMLLSPTGIETLSNAKDLITGGGGPQQLMQGGANTLANIASSWLPMSSTLRSVEQATDPLLRQATPGDVLGKIATGLPGFAEQQPPRFDVFGNAVPNPQQGLGALLPARLGAGAPNPIAAAMAGAGVAPSAVPQTVPYGRAFELQLSPQERQQFEQIRGNMLNQMTAPLANDPRFLNAGPLAQRLTLQPLVQAANSFAERMMMTQVTPEQAQVQGQGQGRLIPTGVLAPVQGYQPYGLSDSDALNQRLQLQHQVLMQSLLSGQTGRQALTLEQLLGAA